MLPGGLANLREGHKLEDGAKRYERASLVWALPRSFMVPFDSSHCKFEHSERAGSIVTFLLTSTLEVDIRKEFQFPWLRATVTIQYVANELSSLSVR